MKFIFFILFLFTNTSCYPMTTGTINALGNVSIGTSLSSNLLDVNGGVSIGTSYAGYQNAPTSGLLVQGNVGIGTSVTTTGSVQNLNVDISQNTGTTIQSENDNSGIYSTAQLQAYNGTSLVKLGMTGTSYTTSGNMIQNQGYLLANSAGFNFMDDNASGDFTWAIPYNSQKMVLTSAGNLGIGTSGPSSPLEISSSIPNLTLTNPNNGSASASIIYRSGSTITTASSIQFSTNGTNPYNADISFIAARTTGSPTNLFIQGNSGNVGIGTITPVGALTVMNGNVGIGTWVPGQMLDVKGTVRALSSGTCSYLYKCVGGVDAGVIQTSACNLCPAGSCTQMNICG